MSPLCCCTHKSAVTSWHNDAHLECCRRQVCRLGRHVHSQLWGHNSSLRQEYCPRPAIIHRQGKWQGGSLSTLICTQHLSHLLKQCVIWGRSHWSLILVYQVQAKAGSHCRWACTFLDMDVSNVIQPGHKGMMMPGSCHLPSGLPTRDALHCSSPAIGAV